MNTNDDDNNNNSKKNQTHDNYMLLKIAVTRRTRAQKYEHKI